MNDTGLTFGAAAQPASLEHLQHWSVLRQDFRTQLGEPGSSGDDGKMAHQRLADALSLILVHHDEGHLGMARPQNDVTPATRDDRSAILLCHGDQGDVRDEIDIQEECNLRFGKIALCSEEASIKRLSARAADGREQAGAVVRSEGPDLHPATSGQRFNRGIVLHVRHAGIQYLKWPCSMFNTGPISVSGPKGLGSRLRARNFKYQACQPGNDCLASHSTGTSARSTAGVSSYADTIHTVHSGAAGFADWNDQSIWATRRYRGQSLC